MSVRGIGIIDGVLLQGSPNEAMIYQFPIKLPNGGRRAIQIYNINFSVGSSPLYLEAGGFAIIGYVRSLDKYGNLKHVITRWCVADVVGGGPTGLDLSYQWLAPPSLVLSDNTLEIGFSTQGMGQPHDMQYQVYYKVVGVTPMQEVQLQLM